MKIVLVGGGTGGPVAPLLAVKEELLKQAPDTLFAYIGTDTELERRLMQGEGVACFTIPAGKLRRYASWRNVTDVFRIIAGFFKSLRLLSRLRPDILFAAGSFVSVPVAYAAFFLRIKIVAHQQDVLPSLSNRLIYPIAARLTVSLKKSLKDFPTGPGLLKRQGRSKLVFTGNPVRVSIAAGSNERARRFFKLRDDLPTLLVLGGGSGSKWLNQLVDQSMEQLTRFFQVIHLTGPGKRTSQAPASNYHCYEYLTGELADAIAIADIVVSRAGFSAISELAVCKKVTVLIPLPDSHQLHNALYLGALQAAVVAPQEFLTSEIFVNVLRKLLFDQHTRQALKQHIAAIVPHDAAKQVARLLLSLYAESRS